jgi:hypothetical protein
MEAIQIVQVVLRACLVLAYCFMVIVANIGTSGFICEFQENDIVRNFPTPITPAPYSFIIWSVIFILQAFFALWAMLPTDNQQTLMFVGPPIFVGMVAHGIWNIAFDCNYMVLEAFMIVVSLLGFAVAYALAWIRLPNRAHLRLMAYKRLRSIDEKHDPNAFESDTPLLTYKLDQTSFVQGTELPLSQSRVMTEVFVVWLPTAMSFAWLCIYAPMAIMIAAESHRQMPAMIDAGWGIAIIVVVTVFGLAIGFIMRDVVFPAVLSYIWLAIAIEHDNRAAGYVAIGALIVSGLETAILAYAHARQLWQLYVIRKDSIASGSY